MYIYVCITLLSFFGSCSAATDGQITELFLQRLQQQKALLDAAETKEGDCDLLRAEGKLTGRFGCGKYLEDLFADTSKPSPIEYIYEQAAKKNKYAQFLCALYSLTGQFDVAAPDSGTALPHQVPVDSADSHSFAHMQQLASGGCAEAIFFLQAVYTKLATSQHGEWGERGLLEEKVTALTQAVPTECQAVFEELVAYLDAQAEAYLTLYGAERAR